MFRVSTGRRATAPVIWITASALAAVPLIGSGPMPTRLAAELTSYDTSVAAVATQAVDDVASAAPTVVGLIARSSAVLGSASVHELAELVENPAATQPLTSVATPQARVNAQTLAVAADGPSASDSLADLNATLQTILGRITDAFTGAPGNIGKALTSLLSGDVRGALQTTTAIFTDPIIFIALFDLPNLSAPLSNLVPPLAPVFNALPNILVNAGLPLLQLVSDVNSSLADAYEGARDGIVAGDVVQAVYKFASATVGLAQKLLDDTIGPQGLLPSLYNAGVALAAAVGQVFNPTPPVVDAASATTDATTADAVSPAAATATAKHAVAGSLSKVTSTSPDAAKSSSATTDDDAAPSDATKTATDASGATETSTGATSSDVKTPSSSDETASSSTSAGSTTTSNGTTGKSSGAGAGDTGGGASSKTGTDTAATGATKPAKTPSKDTTDAAKPEKASSTSTAGHGAGSESKGGDSSGGHAGGGDA